MSLLAVLSYAASAGDAVPLYTVPGRVASVAGDTVVVGDPRHRHITAYTLATGQPLWTDRLRRPGRRSQRFGLEVAVLGERVYTAGDETEIRALSNGRREWSTRYSRRNEPDRTGMWFERSAGACVLSGYDWAQLIDCESSEVLAGPELPKSESDRGRRPWLRRRRAVGCAGMLMFDGTLPIGIEGETTVVAVYENHHAALVGIQRGQEHFRTPLPGAVVWSTEQIGPACVALTIGSSPEGFYSALSGADCTDGQGLWSVALGSHRPRLWQIDGTPVVRFEDGTVLGFDPVDGSERWRHMLGEETLPWFEGDIVERRTDRWPLPLQGARIAHIDVATGVLGEVRTLPAPAQQSTLGGTQILWWQLDGQLEVMLDLDAPPQRWPLIDGVSVWDGQLLWTVGFDDQALHEQGIVGVIDPVRLWQTTFPPGWFAPVIDRDARVPTILPFTPTSFVNDDYIVLSRPDGYWKGEIGVFMRGPVR